MSTGLLPLALLLAALAVDDTPRENVVDDAPAVVDESRASEEPLPSVEPVERTTPPQVPDPVVETAPSTAAPARTDTVYFVGLDRRAIDDQRARLVEDLVLTALSARADMTVRSDRSIEAALSRAADLQAQGCNEESATCLREVALALGTRYVVTGSVGEQDGVVVTELVLVDTVSGLPLGREQLDAASTASFQARLPPTIENLFSTAHGRARIVVAEERPPRAFDDAPVLLAHATAGVAGGACVASVAALFTGAQVVGVVAPTPAFLALLVSAVGAIAAPFGVGGAFVVASLASDAFADAPLSFGRAAAAGIGTFVVVATLTPLVVLSAAGATAIVAFQALESSGIDSSTLPARPELIPPIVGLGVAFSAGLGALVAAASLGVGVTSFAALNDAPAFGDE